MTRITWHDHIVDTQIRWALFVAVGNLHEGQKLSYEHERGRTGKMAAVNLQAD